MIEAKNLKKIYKTKGGVRVNALDGVSLKLPDTGMVFILGKSGSGKSTLLNVLGGLDSFDSGEIIIKGTSAKDFKQSHYDSYRNTYIGFIFQEYNILEELTVGANIALAIELQDRRATDEEINSILKEVDLEGYGQRKPNELSGGQKQRVAIARALVKKPEIIMADEPTGALDSATGRQVFDSLKKLSRDKLVLIVSHDREFSEQYADRIIELKDGKIISDVEKDINSLSEIEATEDSISYGDGEINLKAGYTLTEEDRIAINEYLKSYAEGAVIKIENKEKRKLSSKDFKPTDEAKINSDKLGDFKLIKSKLSIKNSFKLGSGALKYKKIRLVFTILLSLVSFTLFGLADTIAAYDNIKTATNSIYDTGVDYSSYVKAVKRGSGDYEFWQTFGMYLNYEDIEKIKEKSGRGVVGVYKKNEYLDFSLNLGSETVEGMKPHAIYKSDFSGLAPISEAFAAEHGFNIFGRIPDADKNEIAITKYTYDYFEKVGYIDVAGAKSSITQYEDLIGKELSLDLVYNDKSTYTIVGIVDTKFDYSRYEKLASSDAEYILNELEMMSLMLELEAAQEYSFASVCFVNQKLVDDVIKSQIGKPENLMENNFGSISVLLLKNDNADFEYEIYEEDKNNIIENFGAYLINSLEHAKNSTVWLSEPLESLAENQIIVHTEALLRLIVGQSNRPDVYYEPSLLVGFDKELYNNFVSGVWSINKPSIHAFLESPKYFAAINYAYNNPDTVRNIIKDFDSITDEKAQNLDTGYMYHRFGELAENGYVDEVITDACVSEYVDSVISKYSLSSLFLPPLIKNNLIATYTHAGLEYKSFDENELLLKDSFAQRYKEIIARKYAAENFNDAYNYIKLTSNNSDEEMAAMSGEDIIYNYALYLLDEYRTELSDKFIPSATLDFETYMSKLLLRIYSERESGKLVLGAYYFLSNDEELIKNVEIVGVIPESKAGHIMDGNSYAVILSDEVIDKLLGTSGGGVFSYAVGAMPSEKSEIEKIVKFAKRYVNESGNVRYDLVNNVTYQLDMVDEILKILGKVFLYVGIGFAVFSSLMLTNFISTSIAYKKQDIGILRAIGSRSADVFRIFFAESFIIAMINYLLSLLGTLTVTGAINSFLRFGAGILITFLNFGIRQILILFLISMAVAFIATFLPVYKIASMKPIDAIKNRK